MAGPEQLKRCFLPLEQRIPPASCFFRIIGRDGQGEILALLKRFGQLARQSGVYLSDGLENPSEPDTARFFEAVGAQFAITQALVERQMTVWLGQLRPAQRQQLSRAVIDALGLLRQQGGNESVVKNAYIKFMCWFRSSLGHVLKGIGKSAPPKVLFEGEISKYGLLLLHLLHLAGCDVWYLNFTSDQSYQKAARGADFAELVQGEILSPPPVHFLAEAPAAPPSRPAPAAGGRPVPPPSRPAPPAEPPAPPMPRPWEKVEGEVSLNSWVGDRPVWEAVLLPCAERPRAGQKICSLFAACFGADERGAYRNRLFRLRRGLDASGKTWQLIDKKFPAPTVAETAQFRAVDKNRPRAEVTGALCACLAPKCGQMQLLLAQGAFVRVMEACPEQNAVRFYNYGVRLACWIRRYAEALFDGYRVQHQPALVYYGPITEPEVALLWALAHMGVDVLCFSPEAALRREFSGHFLPRDWIEVLFDGSMPAEPFPQREERVRAGTTAYNASRELDQLLYSDTGMFRDRQFARSQPVTLKTTYDEVGQLWGEEAQYRPSFRTESGVVYVPNLFSKICGVDKGDLELYWDRIREMRTPETLVFSSLPFLRPNGPSMSAAQAQSFLHDGRLDPQALKASRFYRYDYLPADTQDYMLEKIQALIDYDLIVNGGPGLPASMLSVLMNLDKELLRLLQNFDFTRKIPKIIVIDVTETTFTLEECVFLAFFNLIGFDIAIFTPTGYRNLEKYLRPDSFDTLIVGEYSFDLTVPDLSPRAKKSASGAWLGRLFGGDRG